MKEQSVLYPTDALWPHDERENLLEKLIRLGSFGAVCLFILFFTGWAPLPFWYEERSLHILGAVVAGGVFGPKLAAGVFILYLASSLLGIPFFAGDGRFTDINERSVGFAAGLFLTVMVSAFFSRAGWYYSLFKAVLASILASLSVFAIGVPLLANLVGMSKALELGFYPYISASLANCVLAALVVRGVVFLTLEQGARQKKAAE